MLLSREVPLHLIGSGGRYRGCLQPPLAASVPRRVAQYELMLAEHHRVRFARAATRVQLRNLSAVLANWSSRRDSDELREAVAEIRRLQQFVTDTTTLFELRGIEGSAWRESYGALARVLPPELGFSARLRRPPPDPANAVLGLLGVMTVNAAASLLRTAGLDPALGFDHGHARGGEALAMDLADIYRPQLCLATTAKLFTKRMLAEKHFEGLGYSATLTRSGMRIVMGAYAEACRREVCRRGDRTRHDYLYQLRADARGLAHCVLHPDATWEPLEVR